MKVTLDACLFGALVCRYGQLNRSNRILDIGTGTGLLALMAAQESTAKIDGVEIDSAASAEATHNIAASPFADRVQIYNENIEKFSPEALYQTIISNPPFFSQSLKGPSSSRNQVRHNDGLSFASLCRTIRQLLADQGQAWLLLPVDEMKQLEICAASEGLIKVSEWHIRSVKQTPVYRSIVCLIHDTSNKQTQAPVSEDHHQVHVMTVRNENGDYTDEFTALLKPFYLKI